MDFLVLGPVEVRIDGQARALGGPKQRAVLALLLLHANEVVSRDRLIDGLWGERAPSSAQRSLDSYVSRLRTVLGNERIERRAPGYVLHVEPGELDLDRFESLLEEGRAAAAAGESAVARDRLGDALALWRGRALADLEYEPFAGAEAGRLEERRLLAVEARNAAALEAGEGAELVGELERLVVEQPLRERLLAQLMLALYRAGRQADALSAYQEFRRRYTAELGLEPGADLRELERRILGQDPALAPRAPGRLGPPRRRPARARIVATALALAALAVSAVIGIELGIRSSNASAGSSRTAVFELDGHSAAAGASLDAEPVAMAADPTSVWLAEPDAGAVVRVDRGTRRQIETIHVGGTPGALAFGGGSLWVASVPGETIVRISPATYGVTERIHLGNGRVAALAFAAGRLWVADSSGRRLVAYDPRTGRPSQTITLDVHPTAFAVARHTIWVADYDGGQLEEVDARSGADLGTIHAGDGPVSVAVGDGGVWVVNSLDSTVADVDPASDTLRAAIPVGDIPTAVAVDGASVVVANEWGSSVSRIDPHRDAVVRTTPVGGGPTVIASVGRDVWVGTRALTAHRGGTLVMLHERPLPLDTALQLDLPPSQSNGLTNDALLAYARVGSALRLVPDLALSVPEPADGGLTYTFRVRRVRYADGRLVEPEDFRRAIERLFRLGSGWSVNYLDIVGATGCTRASCDLRRGIVVDDAARTVTFHLREPDDDFRASMSSIGTAPVPPGVPFRYLGFTPVPGTGPYVVRHADRHEIRYVRNPRFVEWSHVAQPEGNPDVIVMRYGLSPAQEVREVESGKADWTADSVPGSLMTEVTTRYPAQVHALADTATDFLQLNASIPPFNDVRVRQALNYAVDRAAVVRMNGGPAAATPTCQVTPPGLPWYRPYCPYTRRSGPDGRWHAPDLARAERLVAASGTRGELVTVVGASDGGALGTTVVEYVAQLLDRLGYDAQAQEPPFSAYRSLPWPTIQVHSADADCPCESFSAWFGCTAPFDNGWICDPAFDRQVARAKALEAANAPAADALFAKLDREVVRRAWWVPLDNPHFVDFFSKRVRNYTADPALGLIADQVSLK